jgi:hypothetical protein
MPLRLFMTFAGGPFFSDVDFGGPDAVYGHGEHLLKG